jgi:hypothetical protein
MRSLFELYSMPLSGIAPAPISRIRIKPLGPGAFRIRILEIGQDRVPSTRNEVERVILQREPAKRRRRSVRMPAPVRPSPVRKVWPENQTQDGDGSKYLEETPPRTSCWRRLRRVRLILRRVGALVHLGLQERRLLGKSVAHEC